MAKTSGKSAFLEGALLNHTLKTAAYTVPTNIYVALLTSAPTAASVGSAIAAIEANYTGYARVVCNAWDDAVLTEAVENTNAITFGKCTAGDDAVTHVALLDGTAGTDDDHLLYWGPLSETKNIAVNDTPSFAAGAFDITEA